MIPHIYTDRKLEEAMKEMMDKPRIPNSSFTILAIDINYMSIYPFQTGKMRASQVIHTFCRSITHEPHALIFIANRRKGIFVTLQYEKGGIFTAVPAKDKELENFSYHASSNCAKKIEYSFEKMDDEMGYIRPIIFLHREIQKDQKVKDFHDGFRTIMSSLKFREHPKAIHLAELYAIIRSINHDFRNLEGVSNP